MISINDSPNLANGVQLGVHEGLSSKTGLHRHHKNQIQLLNIGQDGICGGDWPQGYRFFYAAAIHETQRFGNAGGVICLQMDGQQVGSAWANASI